MRKPLLVLAAALVLGLAACGGDDEEPVAAVTRTPEATAAPTPAPPASEAPASEAPASAAPASDAPAPGPTAGKATPEDAAQSFFSDWGELDRRSMSGYATQAAIDEALDGAPPNAEFVDCTEEGDHFSCFYYYEGGGLGMTVVDTDAYGWIVTDINFVAD
jgi:hypothetical protein